MDSGAKGGGDINDLSREVEEVGHAWDHVLCLRKWGGVRMAEGAGGGRGRGEGG